jgi:ADP-heptose:LPS heptosyltransferase
VDKALAFDALRLDALFTDESEAPAPPLRRAARVVSWFGAGDAGFVRRLSALVPGAIVAPPFAAGRAAWEHLLRSVGAALEDASRWREPIVAPAELVDEGRRELGRAGWDGATPLVLVHPGSGGTAKRWPVEGFAAVLERLAASGRIVLAIHEGPADRDAVADLRVRLSVPILGLGEPSLTTLSGTLGVVTAYLGNDSGVSHLAAALGVPSVVLYVADKLDWRPWARHVEPLVVATARLVPGDVELVGAALAGLVG